MKRRLVFGLAGLLALAGCSDDDGVADDAGVASDVPGSDADTVQDAGDDATVADGGETIDVGEAIDATPTDAGTDALSPDRIPIIVGIGWQGIRMVSIDEGETWCQTGIMVDGHDDLFRGGYYHDGLFVGAHAGRDNRGAIMISENGYEWMALHRTNEEPDLEENPSGQWYGGVAFGNGTWVAAGGCGQLATSPDARAWTRGERFTDGCDHIRSLLFTGDRFVAGIDSGAWWSSTDGIEWSEEATGVDSAIVWTGSEIEEGRNRRHRGRGLCMWGQGSPVHRLFRSTNADCSDEVEVHQPEANITTVLYGSAPAADYDPDALPGDLRSCLGL